MLHVLLSANGYILEQATNGVEALELARRNPPDIIISDILMPVMDGFSLCRYWKEDESLKLIPFIFYTATYTDTKDEEFAMSLGADRFIIKPAEPEQFLEIIREIIESHTDDKREITPSPIDNKDEYYKEYNEVLVRKLEAKMLQVKRAHQRLAVLYKAISDLAALKPMNELVIIALSAAVEAVGSIQSYYFHFDEHNKQLCFSDAVGVSTVELEALKENKEIRLDERSLVGKVARMRQPIVVPDTTEEELWTSVNKAIRSALFVPVLHEKHLLGVLAVLSDQPNNYSEEDTRNLLTLVKSLAIAIENRRLFEQVKRSELYYRTVLESSADAIIGIDTNYKISVWNLGGEQAFGFSVSEAKAQPFDFLFHSDEKPNIKATLEEAQRNGSVHGFEIQALTKDGRLEDVEMTITHLGEGLGYTAILRVITERKQKEIELESVATISAALRQAESRADMISIILDQLLAMMKAVGAGFTSTDPSNGQMVNKIIADDSSLVPAFDEIICNVDWGQIFNTGQPFSCNEIQQDSRFTGTNIPSNIKAIACAPLINQSETIGVLWIARDTFVNDHDVSMLTSIADMAANAIRRVTLYEQSLHDAQELALAYETTIEGWSHALDLRDRETEGHTLRVTELTMRLARMAGFDEEELVHIRRGALLHDIGKMGIPDTILLKPAQLSDEEWLIMRKHPTYAYDLLSQIKYLHPALDIPYCHHEKWDGTGYPCGLKDEEIPLAARLFAVVDVWDALLSDRPYRSALSKEYARTYLKEQSGTHFDPYAVKLFFQMLDGSDQ